MLMIKRLAYIKDIIAPSENAGRYKEKSLTFR